MDCQTGGEVWVVRNFVLLARWCCVCREGYRVCRKLEWARCRSLPFGRSIS